MRNRKNMTNPIYLRRICSVFDAKLAEAAEAVVGPDMMFRDKFSDNLKDSHFAKIVTIAIGRALPKPPRFVWSTGRKRDRDAAMGAARGKTNFTMCVEWPGPLPSRAFKARVCAPRGNGFSVHLSAGPYDLLTKKGRVCKQAWAGTVSVLTSVRNYCDALAHASVRSDALTLARHRAFIAPRLIGGCILLAVLPIYLALRGAPGLLEIEGFAWIAASIVPAYVLSRTGRYEIANVMSAAALCAAVTAIAWQTGGIRSFAVAWLIIPLLEGALSGSRRTLAAAAVLVVISAVSLFLRADAGSLGESVNAELALAGFAFAALYGCGLAWASESLLSKGVGLLHAEEARYRILVRHMTEAITRHGRNGDVNFASPVSKDVFGIGAEDLLGKGLFDRVHVADRPAYLGALADAAAGETRSLEFRVRAGRNGSNFAWVEMRCRPLDDIRSTTGGREVVAVIRDIGGRKRQEEALNEANAALERANAGKNRFLATMSHELRTPLNAIIGFSEMLSGDVMMPSTERRREYARLINNSGRHLLAVVNGILDMSKMESGNFEITPEPFAPGPIVLGSCDILKLKAQERGVSLDLAIADDLPDLTADPRALSQIMINLVSNAIKFTDRGGKVKVGVRRDGAFIAFSVEDTGIGVNEDDLPRLGEAFFQARASYDRRHDGTGLGLSIVKGLVDLHGGRADIRSRVGEGTCVTVRLPIGDDDSCAAAAPILLEPKLNDRPALMAGEQVRKSA
jgi:cell cycle sensor histidine kinase DivJ